MPAPRIKKCGNGFQPDFLVYVAAGQFYCPVFRKFSERALTVAYRSNRFHGDCCFMAVKNTIGMNNFVIANVIRFFIPSEKYEKYHSRFSRKNKQSLGNTERNGVRDCQRTVDCGIVGKRANYKKGDNRSDLKQNKILDDHYRTFILLQIGAI